MQTVEDIFKKMDWTLLRKQKRVLVNMADRPADQRTYSEAEASVIEGIVNLLDAIQDTAVDDLGYDERDVFGTSI